MQDDRLGACREDGDGAARAAIGLTTTTRTTFTRDELFAEVRVYGGPDCQVHEVDFNIVLPHARFIRRERGRRLSLR